MRAFLAFLCVWLCACGPSPHSTAVDVRAITVPAGQATPGFDEQQREGASMRYVWQLSAPADWTAYAEQFAAQLERKGFRRTSAGEMVFTRSEDNETHRLEMRRDNGRVRFTLTVTAG